MYQKIRRNNIRAYTIGSHNNFVSILDPHTCYTGYIMANTSSNANLLDGINVSTEQ